MEGWAIARLRDLVDFVIGGDWGKAPDFDHEDYVDVLCIRGTELRTWTKDKGASAAPRRIKKASLLKRELREGSVILEVSGGGPEQPVGRVELIDKAAMAHHRDTPRICTNFFRKLEIVEGIDAGYLVHFLKHFYTTGEITRYQAGSNNLRNLKYPEYETIEVPIPPLPEQQRIVEKIETLFAELDKGEEALREVQKRLARYRQSVLKAAVTGTLTADWRSANGQGQWQETKLGELNSLLTSGSRGWAKFYADEGDTFIRAQNLKHDRLDLNDVAFVALPDGSEGTRTRVLKGDILITITGANVTKTALVVRVDGVAYVSQHVALFRPTDDVHPEFLYRFIIAKAGGRMALEKAAYGAGKPGLNLQNIKDVPISLPPIEEQREIVDRLDQLLGAQSAIQTEIECQLAKGQSLRQSILKDAFTGKLVPQDPSDEPADKLLERIRAARAEKPTAKRKKAAA